MLDTLTDMEVLKAIIKSDYELEDASSVSLLDKRFKDLKLKEMAPLGHGCSEFKKLSIYLLESSSSIHGITYLLQDIFRIEQTGESDRFKRV